MLSTVACSAIMMCTPQGVFNGLILKLLLCFTALQMLNKGLNQMFLTFGSNISNIWQTKGLIHTFHAELEVNLTITLNPGQTRMQLFTSLITLQGSDLKSG
jgi:hypothetical protein